MRQISVAAKPIFVDLQTAAAMLSLSESTIQAMVRSGPSAFPQPRMMQQYLRQSGLDCGNSLLQTYTKART